MNSQQHFWPGCWHGVFSGVAGRGAGAGSEWQQECFAGIGIGVGCSAFAASARQHHPGGSASDNAIPNARIRSAVRIIRIIACEPD